MHLASNERLMILKTLTLIIILSVLSIFWGCSAGSTQRQIIPMVTQTAITLSEEWRQDIETDPTILTSRESGIRERGENFRKALKPVVNSNATRAGMQGLTIQLIKINELITADMKKNVPNYNQVTSGSFGPKNAESLSSKIAEYDPNVLAVPWALANTIRITGFATLLAKGPNAVKKFSSFLSKAQQIQKPLTDLIVVTYTDPKLTKKKEDRLLAWHVANLTLGYTKRAPVIFNDKLTKLLKQDSDVLFEILSKHYEVEKEDEVRKAAEPIIQDLQKSQKALNDALNK